MNSQSKQSEIPEGWEEKKLGQIGDAIIGLTYSPSDVVDDGGVLVLRSSNIKNGRIDYEDQVRVSCNISEKLRIKDGDILICARNGSRRLIGKNAIMRSEDENCTFGAFMSVFRTKESKYVYYLFQSQLFKKQIERDLGPTINQVTTGNLNLFKFIFPPPNEKRFIQRILDIWDLYLDKLERKIEMKKNIKKGLMQQLLTGKRQIKGCVDKWQISNLGKLGVFSKGQGISKSELVESGINAVRYGELYTKHNIFIKKIYSYISDESASMLSEIKSGDILFAGSGETIDEIGKSAVYLHKETCYAGGDTVIFTPNDKYDSTFLVFLLNSTVALRQLRRFGQGQSVVHIYKKDLSKLEFLIPKTKREQTMIADILINADAEIELLERRKEKLESQKKYLLNNLITGKIRTPKTMKV